MGIFSKINSKIIIACSVKNIPLSVGIAKKKLANGDFQGALREVKEIHQSALAIMANVLLLEGFNIAAMSANTAEAQAIVLIQHMPKYSKACKALDDAMHFITNFETYAPAVDPGIEEIYQALKGVNDNK